MVIHQTSFETLFWQVFVIESGDEGESEAEAFSSVPVFVCKDVEAFEGGVDVFDADAPF